MGGALLDARELGQHLSDAENIPDDRAETIEQERAVAERHGVLREALVRLPPRIRQLIAQLIEDQPLSFAEISGRLHGRQVLVLS
jgi:hypothetical protein